MIDQFMADIQEIIDNDTGYIAVEDDVPLLYLFMHDCYITWWEDTQQCLAREWFLYVEDEDGRLCLELESLTRYETTVTYTGLLGILPTRTELQALREVPA